MKNKTITTILILLVLCLTIIAPSFASTADDAVLDPSHPCTLHIDYKEDTEGHAPIAGAEFTVYKISTIGFMGNYQSIIPGMEFTNLELSPVDILEPVKDAYGKKAVQDGYSATAITSGDGMASFANLPAGLYVVEESKPAPGYFAANPFFAVLPVTENGTKWVYEQTAEPKPLSGGELIIEKIVSGDLGETQRDFHFVVSFRDYDEPLHFIKSNHTEGTLKSGDTITLKHNEKIKIDAIPAGTEYFVKEVEADTEGYVTTKENDKGNIKRTERSIASFHNAKKNIVNTGDTNIVYICCGICCAAYFTCLLLVDALKKISRSDNENKKTPR